VGHQDLLGLIGKSTPCTPTGDVARAGTTFGKDFLGADFFAFFGAFGAAFRLTFFTFTDFFAAAFLADFFTFFLAMTYDFYGLG